MDVIRGTVPQLGSGYGYGDGSGYGSGYGDGYGSGYGYGDGSGYGSGYGDGYGYGYGYGYGDGSGYGYGDGSGYGYGDGSGYGYGDGSGYGGYGSGDIALCAPSEVLVTVDHLLQRSACGVAVRAFERLFPNGATFPRDVEKARDGGLDLGWARENLGLLLPKS